MKVVVDQILARPKASVELLLGGIARGEIPGLHVGSTGAELTVAESTAVIQYILEIMRASPQIGFLGVQLGTTQSNLYAAERSGTEGKPDAPFKDSVPCSCVKNGVAVRGRAIYAINTSGPLLSPETFVGQDCGYSPGGWESGTVPRPWYNTTVAHNTAGWGTGIYQAFMATSTGAIKLIPSLAWMGILRNAAGQNIGVVIADCYIDSVSKYLREVCLALTPHC